MFKFKYYINVYKIVCAFMFMNLHVCTYRLYKKFMCRNVLLFDTFNIGINLFTPIRDQFELWLQSSQRELADTDLANSMFSLCVSLSYARFPSLMFNIWPFFIDSCSVIFLFYYNTPMLLKYSRLRCPSFPRFFLNLVICLLWATGKFIVGRK